MATTEPLSWAITDADRQARSPMPTFRRCSRGPDGATPSGQIAPTPPQLEQAPRLEGLLGTVVTGVKAALNIILKRLRAPTRGTLMLTKRTGGNVLLYGPILMESLAPGNKGLLSPGPGEDMLSSGKVLLKVTGPGAVLCFQLCCSAHFMVPKAGPCRCRLAGEENWHSSDSWLVDLDRASARRFKSTGLI